MIRLIGMHQGDFDVVSTADFMEQSICSPVHIATGDDVRAGW
jgi:hypothetical protein